MVEYDVWMELDNGTRFTFPPGFISKISSNYESGVEQLKMPMSGPMRAQGFDIDGNGKVISIQGNLQDTDSSVLNNDDMRDRRVMKYWLESLFSGNQIPFKFNSEFEGLTPADAIPSTIFDRISETNVTLPGTLVQTRGYIIGLSIDNEEGDVEKIPFSIQIWVAEI